MQLALPKVALLKLGVFQPEVCHEAIDRPARMPDSPLSTEKSQHKAKVDHAGICHTPHQAYKCGTAQCPFFVGLGAGPWFNASSSFKNASGPVGIHLKRGVSGARQ